MDQLKIGKFIAECRKQKKLTQMQLSEKLNITDKAISKWERGEAVPDIAVLKQIADFYGVTIDVLISEPKELVKNKQKKATGTKRAIIALCSVGLVWLVAMCCFAFSTILGWSLYGTRCVEYLFGSKVTKVYQIFFCCMIIVGSTTSLSVAWDLADTFNGLMAIPNFVALFALSGVVAKATKDHFADPANKLKK